MADQKWIQKANLKAKAAGMSVQAFANKVLKKGSNASPLTKRRATLAKTFNKMAKKKA